MSLEIYFRDIVGWNLPISKTPLQEHHHYPHTLCYVRIAGLAMFKSRGRPRGDNLVSPGFVQKCGTNPMIIIFPFPLQFWGCEPHIYRCKREKGGTANFTQSWVSLHGREVPDGKPKKMMTMRSKAAGVTSRLPALVLQSQRLTMILIHIIYIMLHT